MWTNRDRRRQHPADEPTGHVTRPIRNNGRDQRRQDDQREAGRGEGRRHAPIPPNDFARIKEDVYLVVRRVQMAHHADLWTAGNPVRALTDGVRRLVANIRPPRADDQIMNKLKIQGEKFLEDVQLTVLGHLQRGIDEAESILTRKNPPADDDGGLIFQQAKSLLQKNFGRKLTSTDIDCHLEDACTILYEQDEEPRHPQAAVPAATAPPPNNDARQEDDDDSNDEARAHWAAAVGGLPAATVTASAARTTSAVEDSDTDPEDAVYIRPSRVATRSLKLTRQQTLQGEVLVDQPTNTKINNIKKN